MVATVISNGTRVWLAELLDEGWDAEVVASPAIVNRYRLVLVDDLEEQVRERVTPGRVGVLARRDGASLFFPCADVHEARSLLESAVTESAAA
jgi:hypothetical protein